MNPTGIARTELTIADLSQIVSSGLKGIHGWAGVTERGDVAKPTIVSSWIEYTRKFGGLVDGNDFPLLCKRALESGARLKISRVVHYDDIDDKTSITGVKAVSNPPKKDPDAPVEVGVYGFSAKSIGAWGNNLTVSVKSAMSGREDFFDITVTLAGYPELTQVITDVLGNAESVDSAEIVAFNAKANLIDIISVDNPLKNTELALSGGEDTEEVVVTDYIGSSVAMNGIHAFDNDVDITKISIPGVAIPEVDIALAAYATNRGDLIALLRTPVGIDGATAVDYREGTGIYEHAFINTWYAMMFTGGLKVTHPKNGATVNISEIGDVAALFTKKDNSYGEWFSFSGRDRGSISNTLGVVYNLGSTARRAEADLVDARGLNMVIQHPSFGVVSWGNSTLYKSDTLLKKAEVAELMVFISRSLKPIVEVELFNPNDVATWKAIWRKVTAFMDYIKAERAIWDYDYQGDQDIDDVADAVINTSQGIDQGLYVFNLFVAPKVAMKYIGIRVAVTNSGVKFETLSDSL